MKFFCRFQALIVLFILVLVSCSEKKKLIKLQEPYLPAALAGVYIGIPMEDLEKARGINNLSVTSDSYLPRIKEEYSRDSIFLFTYQFGKDKKLYEVIIDYNEDYDFKTDYVKKYGPFNNGAEWLFTLNKDLRLKIWIYQHRLCIADSKHFRNS